MPLYDQSLKLVVADKTFLASFAFNSDNNNKLPASANGHSCLAGSPVDHRLLLLNHFDGQYTDSEFTFIDLLRIMIGWRNVPCDHHCYNQLYFEAQSCVHFINLAVVFAQRSPTLAVASWIETLLNH